MENGNSNKRAAHKRAAFFDKVAKYGINAGGFAVIIAVFGILFFILKEGLPLLYSAETSEKTEIHSITEKILYTGIEEYQKLAYVIKSDAKIDIINLDSNKVIQTFQINELENRKIHILAADFKQNKFAVGLDSVSVGVFNLKFEYSFDQSNNRVVIPEYSFENIITLDSASYPIEKLNISVDEDENISLIALADTTLYYYSEEEGFSLLDEGEKTIYEHQLNPLLDKTIENFTLSDDGKELFVITEDNNFEYISFADKEMPELVGRAKSLHDSKITYARFLLGNQSVIIGDDKGNLYSYMKSRDDNSSSGWIVQLSHTFESMGAAIKYISASARNKSFIVGAENGDINLYYLTSERLLLSEKGNGISVEEINFAPKADGYIALYSDGSILKSHIENPHPEVSFTTLFGKILYEGYKDPEYVWQSTGGSDAFEPKFSLIPLILGTMKGTLYAMIFAIPLALLGALYTSTFSHPFLKNKIKPVVEILAALPSVVIGFLAGLWLAPLLERIFPGAVLMFAVQPIMIVIGVIVWRNSKGLQRIIPKGFEMFLIIPLLILGGWISIQLGPWFESFALGGDYRHWIAEYFNTDYDQRNAIIVGFAMGFAVIPIIFTIAEDSLSGVPQHLTSASLALGATKWQTAVRVVLPTASPGIFSAIMIGFGRAIGETMIVLMATGNTPILSFSPFNGMRTLSANIAVEIPEAPYHGTLYRVLFVSAALLFILTFIVNTIAELVRQRLRKKYMHI